MSAQTKPDCQHAPDSQLGYRRLCGLQADLRAVREGQRDTMTRYLAAKFAVAEASLGSLIDSMLAKEKEQL